MKNIILKPGMYFLRELDMKKYEVVSRSEYKIIAKEVGELWGTVINVGEGIKVLTKKEAFERIKNL